jgi:D-alanyl-D-alanine carboxypeptidase (penicillin-binding protein 5/6)
MKTGHTEEAGYGLTATAERDGRKVALVVAGLSSPRERAVETEKLLNWAYREFRTGALFRAGEAVADAEVWIGAARAVPVGPAADVVVTAPVAAADQIRARIVYEGPAPAPIAAGQHVADLVVETPGVGPVTYPLVALQTVPAGGVVARVEAAARLLLAGVLGEASR